MVRELEYVTDVEDVKCLNCGSLWRIERAEIRANNNKINAELLRCPLCDFEE